MIFAPRRPRLRPPFLRRPAPLPAPPSSSAFAPAGPVTGIAWSPDGRWLVLSHTTTPFVTAYEWQGANGFGEKLTQPSTLPAGNGQAATFNPAGTLLAVGHATTPFMSVYKWGGGFGDKLSDPTTLPTAAVNSIAFSPDGQYIAAAADTSEYVRAWPINPRTGFSTLITAPTSGPGAASKGVLFTSAGRALGSTLSNTLRRTPATWEVQAQFTREAYYKAVMALTPSSYWRLNETGGTTAADIMRAAAGSYQGGFTLAQTPLLASDEGYATLLNGSTGYINVSDVYDFTGTPSFSIAGLVKLTDPVPVATFFRYLDKRSFSGTVGGWALYQNASGGIGFDRVDSGSGQDTANGPSVVLQSGVVYHFAATYNGSQMIVYINGVAGTPQNSSRSLPNTTQAMAIGGITGGTGTLPGAMQEVALWSGTALSAAQVLALYTASAAFGTDLRPYMEGPLQIDRGLSPDGKPQVGTISIDLDNESGIFTPENSSSALYGLLQPFVPIRIRATDPVTGLVKAFWRGEIMRYPTEFVASGRPRITIECESRMGHLQRVNPSTRSAGVVNTDADDAIAAIMAAVGGRAIDLDTEDEYAMSDWFAGAYYWALDYGTDALTQMAAVAEGTGCLVPRLFEGKDGKVKYRSTKTLGSNAGATDRWGDYSVIKPISLLYDARHEDRSSSIILKNTAKGSASSAGTIYTWDYGSNAAGGSWPLSPGANVVIEGDYGTWSAGSPYNRQVQVAVTVVTPVASTDYLGNTAANGSGTDRTSSLSVSFTDGGTGHRTIITNTHASDTVYITLFQVRATQIQYLLNLDRRTDDPLFRANELSPTTELDMTWGTTGRAMTAFLLTKRYAVPRLTAVFDWDSDAIQTAMLNAELCELVEIEDAQNLWSSAVRDVWRIESLHHEIYPSGNDAGTVCRTTVELRPSWAFCDGVLAVADMFDKASRANTLGAVSTERSVDSSWNDYRQTGTETWSISSSAAVGDGTAERWSTLDTANVAAYNSGHPGKDMVAKVTLEGLLDAGSSFVAGIVYHESGVSNHFRVQLDRANLQVQLIKRLGATPGIDGIVAAVPWTLEDTAELRLVVQGSRHRVYLNGGALPVIDTVEDRGLLTGSEVGIYEKNGTGVKFKRFMACGMN